MLYAFIVALLTACPAARITKVEFRKAFEYSISARPIRKIQPKVTRKELVKLISGQVA